MLVKKFFMLIKQLNKFFFEGTYGPVPYNGCHVVNKNYWYCDIGDEVSGITNIISYKNGVYKEDTPSSRQFTSEYFGIIKYWWYKFIN